MMMTMILTLKTSSGIFFSQVLKPKLIVIIIKFIVLYFYFNLAFN